MPRLLRLLVCCLMAMALPLQGLAAVVRLHCQATSGPAQAAALAQVHGAGAEAATGAPAVQATVGHGAAHGAEPPCHTQGQPPAAVLQAPAHGHQAHARTAPAAPAAPAAAAAAVANGVATAAVKAAANAPSDAPTNAAQGVDLAGTAAAADMADRADTADAADPSHRCSACAACSVGLALTSRPTPWPASPAHSSWTAHSVGTLPSVALALPKRPPRSAQA